MPPGVVLRAPIFPVQLAAFGHRAGADVFPVDLQQVVGHQDDRGILEQFLAYFFAADPGLKDVEAQWLARRRYGRISPSITVPLGSNSAKGPYSGYLSVHQFFAAGPYEELVIPDDHLAADAVPFVFRLPFARGTQFAGVLLQLVSQVEGVRAADVIGGRFTVDEVGVGCVV